MLVVSFKRNHRLRLDYAGTKLIRFPPLAEGGFVKAYHRRPNRVLWGLRSFSNKAISAAAAVAVSNCNIKTAALFLRFAENRNSNHLMVDC